MSDMWFQVLSDINIVYVWFITVAYWFLLQQLYFTQEKLLWQKPSWFISFLSITSVYLILTWYKRWYHIFSISSFIWNYHTWSLMYYRGIRVRGTFSYNKNGNYSYQGWFAILTIQSSAVITLYNITWYYMHHCSSWGRIWIRDWIHKRYPIPPPDGQAMGCLLWEVWRKLTAL